MLQNIVYFSVKNNNIFDAKTETILQNIVYFSVKNNDLFDAGTEVN